MSSFVQIVRDYIFFLGVLKFISLNYESVASIHHDFSGKTESLNDCNTSSGDDAIAILCFHLDGKPYNVNGDNYHEVVWRYARGKIKSCASMVTDFSPLDLSLIIARKCYQHHST